MPELRKDPITNRWVIIATERAKRPMDFAKSGEEMKSAFCPFDYGNEYTTPPEIMAFRPPDTEPNSPGWWIRVVPNKFPALDPSSRIERYGHGMYDAMMGFGYHEIVIETPDHNATIATMEDRQVEEVVWAYKARYNALAKIPDLKYILIFKNHKRDAGASLAHAHSQIIATPIIPKRVQEEMSGAQMYFQYKERCVFCDIIYQERMESTRIVEESDRFIAINPYASRFPFETWVLPKNHSHDFGKINEKEVQEFSQLMRRSLLRIHKALENPPYNFMLHTSPTTGEGNRFYHWHLEIVPRLTKVAGFEWGSGFYINPTPPEDAAKFLRGVEL
ncbi:MAG TPA: galactose-1-phosphate uridylyltransferase [Thermotogota bacterium]|nr:galactose-1-phosphate uridylyltransferase [Thermotogota bacterium]HRW91545.1 galactose-1-phosphate uridylyltransferase [Thermotogota bacterium]